MNVNISIRLCDYCNAALRGIFSTYSVELVFHHWSESCFALNDFKRAHFVLLHPKQLNIIQDQSSTNSIHTSIYGLQNISSHTAPRISFNGSITCHGTPSAVPSELQSTPECNSPLYLSKIILLEMP